MSIMNFIRSKRFLKSKLKFWGNDQEFAKVAPFTIVWPALILLIFFGVTGCAAANSGSGNLEVRLWDHREAIDDFSKLQLTLSTVGIHPANQARSRGWIELTPSIQELDLTQYMDGQQATIATAEIETASYDAVRLTIDQAAGVLKDGQPVKVNVRFDVVALDFRIRDGETTVVGIDLMVLDMSDHPDQGYELHLREAMVVRNNQWF